MIGSTLRMAALLGAACLPSLASAQMLAPIVAPPQSPQPGVPPPELVPGGAPGAARTPQVFRWTEDWKTPPKADQDRSPLDLTRYIPLAGPNIYLSLGGELRYYYNDFHHASLGIRANDDNSPLQERIRLLADLHVTPLFRAFLEIGHNTEYSAELTTPPNRDKWDFEQAFVDVTLPISSRFSVTLRPGRFEMPLGSGKLVGLREGTNQHYIYQGAQGVLRQKGAFALDLFYVRPVQFLPGAWDDHPDHARRFRGAYLATNRSLLIKDVAFDAYFYDVERANARYVGLVGVGEEHRRSAGLRAYGRHGHWDYDLEGLLQFGNVATPVLREDIHAWGVLFEGGYSFPGVFGTPRLGLRANAFSGDRRPTDGSVNTFSAPAIKAPLFTNTDAAWFAESNIMDLFPMATLRPLRGVQIVAGPDLIWRQQRTDAIYAIPTFAPLATPAPTSRFVAATYNLVVDWQATRHVAFRAMYSHLNPSASFRAAGGKESDFLGIQGNLRI